MTEATDKPSSSAAKRMRLHRKLRGRGFRSVRVLVHAKEIEALVRKGYLHPDDSEGAQAIGLAVGDFLNFTIHQ